MSERYLALPRGINVGKSNRVPMAELRTWLTCAGYTDVATVLQSGNVILTASERTPEEVAADVQRVLVDHFDVSSPCVVRTADQVLRIIERNPLRAVVDDPSRYLVNFLSAEPDGYVVQGLSERDFGPEVLDIDGTEAYVWTPEGVRAMTLTYAYLEKHLGVVATARNWNTLQKVIRKF